MTKTEKFRRAIIRLCIGDYGLRQLEDYEALERMRDVHKAYAEVRRIEAEQAALTIEMKEAQVKLIRAIGGPQAASEAVEAAVEVYRVGFDLLGSPYTEIHDPVDDDDDPRNDPPYEIQRPRPMKFWPWDE